MRILSGVKIKNYRSFLDDGCNFDSLTTIVGANESGKTNTLMSIYHLAGTHQKIKFDNGDLRLDSPGFPHNAKVEISYTIKLTKQLAPISCQIAPVLAGGRTIDLVKSGKLQAEPSWKVKVSIFAANISDIYVIAKKSEFRKVLRDSAINHEQIDYWYNKGWLYKEATYNISFAQNPYSSLIRSGVIQKMNEEKKIEHLKAILLEEVLSNTQIIYWKYDTKNFLPDRVPIESFLAQPSSYESIDNILQISGWKKTEYRKNLVELDSLTRNQLLQQAQDTVNKLIKVNWTSHKNLKVSLNFDGPDLSIALQEPGYNTPPNFRSDGFKWFLTFLLFFKRHAAKLENNIILIDEPGLFLHPKGQKDILKELINLSQKNQLVYSTHQTFLIDKNNPSSVRVIARVPHKVGPKTYYDSVIKTINNGSNILSDKLVREALGFIVSDISPINEKNVLVEGSFDRDLLLELNSYFKNLDLNEVSIISCGGAPQIKNLYALCSSNNLSCVGLYDSDSGGQNAFRAATTISQKLHYQALQKLKKIETAEDLIPKDVFDNVQAQWIKRNKLSVKPASKLPRMKALEPAFNSLDKESKLALKHDLETSLIKEIRQRLPANLQEYDLVKDVLTALKEKL